MGLVGGGKEHRIPIEPGSTPFSWLVILTARDLPCQVKGALYHCILTPKP